MATPWQTLRHAIAQLHAGDRLYIRGGTYFEAVNSSRTTVPGGTSWANPITVAGYPGEVAILKPENGLNGIELHSSRQQYLIFQDFVVDMSSQFTDFAQNGFYSDGGASHLRLLRLEIKNNINFGIGFGSVNGTSAFNEVLNCKIHDNGAVGGAVTNGHGLYISTNDNVFDGNEVYNNQGYGVNLYSNVGPLIVSGNIVRNNTIHDNGLHGGTAYGIVVAWGDANQVYNNSIYSNPGGIQVYTNSSNANVYNNIIRNNAPLQGVVIQYAAGTVVKDNAIYANETDIVDLGIGTRLSNNHGP
jgi:hypothetical protein